MWTIVSLCVSIFWISVVKVDSAVSIQPPSPLNCRLGSKPCKDGSDCVPYNHVCDGERDCNDGSDEEDCETVCSIGQFQCAHGQMCIDTLQVCDGVSQCQDRSDEFNCVNTDDSCAHRCDNLKRCLPESFVCDGDADCIDGTDEANCVKENCSTAEFRCASGQCVSLSLYCDGHPDCHDYSDEEGCAQPPPCATQHRCPHSHECLLEAWLCDGEEDCRDGWDEKGCTKSQVECGAFQRSCSSGTQCVPQTWWCDDARDCSDESDETGCVRESCPPHLFQCRSLECLDLTQSCDGIPNCLDGSDEGGNCSTARCFGQFRCSQDCRVTPTGAVGSCWCRVGFRPLGDGVSCEDVDECLEESPGLCSHSCVNTEGSYLCKCHYGYILEPDGRSCKITGEPYLLASVQSELLLLGLQTFSLDVLLSLEKSFVYSVDYDWKEQKVYWVNLNGDAIKWSSLDQKSKGTLTKGLKADCIAVDWVGRNMYWIDSVGNQINAMSLLSGGSEALENVVILDEDVEQPRSLALLPQRGLMFWSETGSEAKIKRAGMDGSNQKVLVNSKLRWPIGLTVDPLQDRIYWTDEKLKCIGSATLNGKSVKILQLMGTPRPFSVSIFNDMVYWSDTKRGSIQRANKITGKKHQVLLKLPAQPFGLKVLHALLQSPMQNLCDVYPCSHLCVLGPGPKPVCKCPSPLLLDEDQFSCSKPKDSSFVLLLSPTAVTQIHLQGIHSARPLQNWPEHLRLELPSMNESTTFDLALQNMSLYVVDAGQPGVWLFEMNRSALMPEGQLFRLQGESVLALALDWVTLNLYWSSTTQPSLRVTSTQAGHTALLLQDDVGLVESIALHPPTGRMCFTSAAQQQDGTRALVECANMDGGNRVVVWSKSVRPASLVFTSEGSGVYWADMDLGIIGSVGVDGTGYIEIKTDGGLTALALTNNMLLWMTRQGTTKVWYSAEGVTETLWFEVDTEVLSMKAFSQPSQRGSNSCSNGNGGCSHLCLAFPGGRTCRCGHDHHAVGTTGCFQDPRCPVGTKPCLHGSTCLPLSVFCDGKTDCPDYSDELCTEDRVMIEMGTKSPDDYSTSTPEDTSPDSSILAENLDAASCDEKRCNGQGTCVTRDGATACACSEGYEGEFCQEQQSSPAQGRVLYIIVGACSSIVTLIAVIVFVKRTKASDRRRDGPAVREMALRNMDKNPDKSARRPVAKDAEFTEDMVSSVD